MERVLAFSTFLKLLELPQPRKATALRGFRRGGGYNYWRPLQILAPAVVKGELGLGEIQEQVGQLAKGHQRTYNDRAVTNLAKWFSRRQVQYRSRPERIVKKFGNAGLKVKIEPEVAFLMEGRKYLMHIWSTKDPILSEETLSAGLFFFRHHFREAGQENVDYLIFDTVKGRVFAEFDIVYSASALLAEQRDLLSDLWSAIEAEPDRPRSRSTTPEDDRPERRP